MKVDLHSFRQICLQMGTVPLTAGYPFIALVHGMTQWVTLRLASMLKNIFSVSPLSLHMFVQLALSTEHESIGALVTLMGVCLSSGVLHQF